MQEAAGLHRTESDALNNQLRTMAAHAAAAEAVLAETRKSLAAHTEESIEARRKAAEVIRERDTAAKLVGELQERLKARDRQVGELDQSRAKLMAQTASLLEAFEARSAALAGAEARAGTLAEQVAHFESRAILAQRQVESLTAKLHSQDSALAEAAEAVQSLAKRAADAEAKSQATQSERERLIVRMQSHEAALAEACDSIQMLAGRAAAAEASARAAHSEARELHEKIRGQETALAEAADSMKALTARAAVAEASAQDSAGKVAGLTLELQQEQARRAIAEVAFARVETESVRLRRQVETFTRRNHELEENEQRAGAAIEPGVARAAPRLAIADPAILPTAASRSARSLLADTVSL